MKRYLTIRLKIYLNTFIEEICNYLDIETEVIVSSSVDIDHRLKGQDKVIAICKQLDADLYINSLGGAKLYEKDKFEQEGVKLDFIIPSLIEYRQYGKDFTPGLSIIDLIMFNSVDEVKRKLNEYTMLYGSTIT